MTRKRLTVAAVALLGVIGAAARTQAFLGIGDVVFDPAVYAQAVEQVIRLEQQYAQLVQSYYVLRNQYEQQLWAARRVPVDMASQYKLVKTAWRPTAAGNTYGTTTGWISAINTGQNVATGFAQSTEPLPTYGSSLSRVPVDQAASLKTGYGTLELADGALEGAIDVIGRLRANAPAVEAATTALERDSLSSAPEMNTQVAVLNKINAADLAAVRSAQDTNKLLVALAESQAIEAKRLRDAEARAIRQHVQFLAEGREALSNQAAGASAALQTWRMP